MTDNYGSLLAVNITNNIFNQTSLPIGIMNSPAGNVTSQISRNQFINCDATGYSTTKATVDLIYHRNGARLIVSNNVFTNNTNPFYILRVSTSTTNTNATISDNVLTANTVTDNVKSVLAINGYWFRLMNNTFMNPDSLYELDSYISVTPPHIYAVTAPGNYWGTSSTDWAVRARIIDSFRSPNLLPVQFHPYCLDQTCTTMSGNGTSNAFINNGTALAGRITTNLTIPAGTYNCYGLYVASNVNLILSPGFTCLFYPLSSIWVDGSLTLAGTAASPITFNAIDPSRNWGRVYIRPTWALRTTTNVVIRNGGSERTGLVESFGFDNPINATVSNLVISNSAGYGIRIATQNCVSPLIISNMSVSFCGRQGVYVDAASGCVQLNQGTVFNNTADGILLLSGFFKMNNYVVSYNGWNGPSISVTDQNSGFNYYAAGYTNQNFTITNSDFTWNNR